MHMCLRTHLFILREFLWLYEAESKAHPDPHPIHRDFSFFLKLRLRPYFSDFQCNGHFFQKGDPSVCVHCMTKLFDSMMTSYIPHTSCAKAGSSTLGHVLLHIQRQLAHIRTPNSHTLYISAQNSSKVIFLFEKNLRLIDYGKTLRTPNLRKTSDI